MKIPKLGSLIEVIWIDAETRTGWVEAKEVVEKPKAKFKTVGFLQGIDDEYIYVAWTIPLEGNTTYSKDSIPLGCIKKVKKIG